MLEVDHELRDQLRAAADAVPEPAGPPPGLLGAVRRQRRVRTSAAGLAAVVVIATIAVALRPPAEDRTQVVDTGPGPTLDVAEELGLRSAPLPEGPLAARRDASAVWTGTQLIVWGGTGAGQVFSDGAAYDPRTGAWRPTAAGPLEPRTRHIAAWTGREMIVWGGTTTPNGTGGLVDGAAYDPVTDRWRRIADAPEDRTRAEAVVAGDRVVVGGGGNGAGSQVPDLLVYDSAEDTWSRIRTDGPVVDVASGSDVVALVVSADRERATAFAVSPEHGTTSALPALPSGRQLLDTLVVAANGDAVVIVAGNIERSEVLVLEGDRWQEVAEVSLSELYVQSGLSFPGVGHAWLHRGWLVVSGPAGVQALSPADGELVRADSPPEACGADAAVAMAPDAVYVWGGQNCDGAAGGGTTSFGRRVAVVTRP